MAVTIGSSFQSIAGPTTLSGGVGADRYHISGNASRAAFTTQGVYKDTTSSANDPFHPLDRLVGTLGRINATLTVETGAGGFGNTRDVVNIGAGGATAGLTGSADRSGSATVVTGLSMPGQVSVSAPMSGSVFVQIGLSSSGDLFDVLGVAANANLYVFGGTGDDTLNVGVAATHLLAGIDGVVAFFGGSGNDTLNAYASARSPALTIAGNRVGDDLISTTDFQLTYDGRVVAVSMAAATYGSAEALRAAIQSAVDQALIDANAGTSGDIAVVLDEDDGIAFLLGHVLDPQSVAAAEFSIGSARNESRLTADVNFDLIYDGVGVPVAILQGDFADVQTLVAHIQAALDAALLARGVGRPGDVRLRVSPNGAFYVVLGHEMSSGGQLTAIGLTGFGMGSNGLFETHAAFGKQYDADRAAPCSRLLCATWVPEWR